MEASVGRIDIDNEDCQTCVMYEYKQVDGCEHFKWYIDFDTLKLICTAHKEAPDDT